MNKSNHIVFTTIYHPIVLNDLYQNIAHHGHLDDTKIWIVGDRKTPESVRELSQQVNAQGLDVVYLDLAEQEKIRETYQNFYDRLPFNNETRRNLGYLKALEQGCEVLISIDDDNFPVIDDDFVGHHKTTGSSWDGHTLAEPSGFHNICEYLTLEPVRHVYPRGFPFHHRSKKNESLQKVKPHGAKVGVTAGLWLHEPDVDATTWLNGKIHGHEYTGDKTHVLAQDTWTPINTQNTSVVRELIPAYLCIPMGWEVPGGKINRYGDIWGGYFLQALMKNTNYHVAFGRPLVEHRRNPHNYVEDLRHEYWGMMLTDWLLEGLKNKFDPQDPVMTKRVVELANFLNEETHTNLPAWCPTEMANFMHATSDNLRHWADACEVAIGASPIKASQLKSYSHNKTTS
ncbi:MAG: hypothetical protein K0S38_768 [Candidatus Paceibacter sp.]|jgi:hypothetical protein|nr:hypothetical protein [Candidatus Paceibacter sp.]